MSKLSKLINHPVDFVRDSRVVRSAIEWTGATWLKAPKPTDGPPQRPKPPKWFHAKPGSELSWDSHSYVDDAPDTLVRGVEGNESMRRKFELMCREAQDKICKAIVYATGRKCHHRL